MGKARIVSGGAEGLYDIEVLHNRERIEAELLDLEERLEELIEQKAEDKEVLNLLQMELEEATIFLSFMIDNMAAQ